MAGHLLIGFAMILFIIAFLRLARLFEAERSRLSSRIGGLFGIIARPIMVAQTLAQGTIMVRLGRTFVSVIEEDQRQRIAILYKGLSNFDIGIDLALDLIFLRRLDSFGLFHA
jgi:hypothetical protein